MSIHEEDSVHAPNEDGRFPDRRELTSATTARKVVGDSALILRQLRDYKPPKNPRLLALYSQARRLADQIGVRHWSHHVRAHNKMADALANLAMDSRASSQVQHPSARSGHCGLSAHLSNDIRPWMADAVSRHGTLSVAF
jgi:hypothetical protein